MAAANQTTQEYTLFNAKGEKIALVRANSQQEALYKAGVSQDTAKEVPASKIQVTTKHDSAFTREKG